MPRRGENIYKRKDGRWEGRYIKLYDAMGKAKYGYVYAHSYLEVKKKMRAVELSRGPSTVCLENPEVFSDYALKWLEESKIHWKESTQVKYTNLLSQYILPVWKNVKIKDIDQVKYEYFCRQLMLEGGKNRQGLSVKTIADITSIFKNILSYAKSTGLYTVPEISFRSKSSSVVHMRVLSKIEQEKLCCYLMSDINLYNIGILICLFTGLRIGELCALEWKDIHLDERTIYIHQTMQRIQCNDNASQKTKVLVSSPKSNCSIRRIPIPDVIFPIILSYGQSRSGYFLTGSQKMFVEPRTMHNHFKAVLKKNNISDANFHSLRHTFATQCIEHGVDVKTLSEILGHANVNITLNRYVHPSMELKRDSINRLSDLISVE